MSHYRNLTDQLCNIYGKGEAQSIARWVMEDCFGLSQTDLLLGKDSNLSEKEIAELQNITERLLKNEPIQYILGHTSFCGLTIDVAPGVLIPRPETAELVDWIIETVHNESKAIETDTTRNYNALDIGTGSGCIALALANNGLSVEAWDISEDALKIAQSNAHKLSLNVSFRLKDVLQIEATEGAQNSPITPSSNSPKSSNEFVGRKTPAAPLFDVIVSNPPYICNSEMNDMTANVLDYEPHTALFVPDNDPLLFYRAIATYAALHLNKGGHLFFEINRAYAKETTDMLESLGFIDIIVRQDQFGNDRMIKASKPL